MTRRVLIAVLSCFKETKSGANEAIRQTWGKSLPPNWDLRFFLGGEKDTWGFDIPFSPPRLLSAQMKTSVPDLSLKLKDDEIVLPVPDGYYYLPWKTKGIFEWGKKRGYTNYVKTDTDCYVFPHRIAASGVLDLPFAGWCLKCDPCPAHPTVAHSFPAGVCYVLEDWVANEITMHPIDHWCEDTWVGFAAASRFIALIDESRFNWNMDIPISWNKNKFGFTQGNKTEAWKPSAMVATHRKVTTEIDKYSLWSGYCRFCGGENFKAGMHGPECLVCRRRNVV